MPAGKTAPLEVQWLGAFNHPLEEPTIRIKFDDTIDPVEVTPERIRVEPAVEKMKLLASDDVIEITGSFDLTQRYKVTISPQLKGDRGYGLAAESHWGATFHPKESCLIFPSSQVFARARQELRFAFFQINTPQVTWKLARVPAEKLSAVTARVREFAKDATDPVTGKVVIDPRTGFANPVRGSITTAPVMGSLASFSNSFTRAVTADSFSAGMRASFHVTCGVLTWKKANRNSWRARANTCLDGKIRHDSFGRNVAPQRDSDWTP